MSELNELHAEKCFESPHEHVFNQDQISSGERRTLLVVILSGLTMLVEITSGVAFGSIALLADGLHMASHTVALGISVFAYLYARRYAGDERFNFSTGKVNSLAGFTSAIALMGFAFFMIWESVERLMNPVKIAFDQAIVVAVIGLMVNIISAYILGEGHDREHHHDSHQHSHHHDHNLRGAYLHVLADAMTSVLAITALLVGKYLGWFQLDALMGIVGALVVTRWAWGLIRETSGTLLDKHIPEKRRRQVIDAIEKKSAGETQIADLHIWSIGAGIFAAELVVLSDEPQEPGYYKDRIPSELGIVHSICEVHQI